MAIEPTRLWDGVDVDESVVGVGARFHGIFQSQSHPVQVFAAACRSRSSRLRSNRSAISLVCFPEAAIYKGGEIDLPERIRGRWY